MIVTTTLVQAVQSRFDKQVSSSSTRLKLPHRTLKIVITAYVVSLYAIDLGTEMKMLRTNYLRASSLIKVTDESNEGQYCYTHYCY